MRYTLRNGTSIELAAPREPEVVEPNRWALDDWLAVDQGRMTPEVARERARALAEDD